MVTALYSVLSGVMYTMLVCSALYAVVWVLILSTEPIAKPIVKKSAKQEKPVIPQETLDAIGPAAAYMLARENREEPEESTEPAIKHKVIETPEDLTITEIEVNAVAVEENIKIPAALPRRAILDEAAQQEIRTHLLKLLNRNKV